MKADGAEASHVESVPITEMEQQKKPRKVGRPRFLNGEAKVRIVVVRFTAQDFRLMEAAANSDKKTLSAWIRSKCMANFIPRSGLADGQIGTLPSIE